MRIVPLDENGIFIPDAFAHRILSTNSLIQDLVLSAVIFFKDASCCTFLLLVFACFSGIYSTVMLLVLANSVHLSDQDLHCLPFHLHLFEALLYGKATLFKFFKCPNC